ncbi:M24 family metallopeptidase [Symbiobacterium thermophilum]|uniref:Aminopeptidase P family protein n=1 Tax=Symbiobacterium thermophilum TaxID=2734 RepID=A0A953I2J2_SYMTR|nr:Xaa-Pro peptidase family protein [Symbiobacterium thermophilum]MBY6277202.1 aminopeptidase P family protein [Symbiobacterium thermophilum]
MLLTPRHELDLRIGRLQAALRDLGLDGALLHSTTSLLYFTGSAQQGHLWVPANGEPRYLVRRVLERARRESALPGIEPLTTLRALPDHLGGARRIGMELDRLPVAQFEVYRRHLPGVDAADVGPVLRRLRSVKSPWEVERIRAAARAADETYRALFAALREGMTELELSVVGEGAQRLAGAQGMIRWHAHNAFESPAMMVLAGETALAFSFADTPFGGEGLTPAAPYGASRRPIRRDEPVCVDFPTVVDGYVHDQTRTMVIGKLPRQLVEAHDTARQILDMVAREARPGATGQQLWERSVDIARRAGLEEHFMGAGNSRVRFVGHGVGLELDEWPILAPKQTTPLEAGNVIAVEPKFFFPGVGAVGLESTFLVTPDGAERLSITPEELGVKDA